jgi:hypothetical protein
VWVEKQNVECKHEKIKLFFSSLFLVFCFRGKRNELNYMMIYRKNIKAKNVAIGHNFGLNFSEFKFNFNFISSYRERYEPKHNLYGVSEWISTHTYLYDKNSIPSCN